MSGLLEVDTAIFGLVISSGPIFYRAGLVKMVFLIEETRIGDSMSDEEGLHEWGV